MDTATIVIIVIGWTLLSFLVGTLGENRKIGMWGAFFVSLLTSPIIGLLVVIASDRVDPTENIKPRPLLNANEAAYQEGLVACKTAQQYADTGNLDMAISVLEKAFLVTSNHPYINYNLACCYSRKHDAEQGLKHLKFAVTTGYNNYSSFETDKDLAFLREQEAYKAFKDSGFKVLSKPAAKQSNTDKYELLERIGKLKQDGILSEEEFEKEKAKILSMS